jgi:hypothetical protein
MARGPAWNADHIAGLGKEAAPVHFVKTAALENAKNLGLRMLRRGGHLPGALMVSMIEKAPRLQPAPCGRRDQARSRELRSARPRLSNEQRIGSSSAFGLAVP